MRSLCCGIGPAGVLAPESTRYRACPVAFDHDAAYFYIRFFLKAVHSNLRTGSRSARSALCRPLGTSTEWLSMLSRFRASGESKSPEIFKLTRCGVDGDVAPLTFERLPAGPCFGGRREFRDLQCYRLRQKRSPISVAGGSR